MRGAAGGRQPAAAKPLSYYIYIFYHHFYCPTGLRSAIFWTSRGHRRRPFPPRGYVPSLLSRIGFCYDTALIEAENPETTLGSEYFGIVPGA